MDLLSLSCAHFQSVPKRGPRRPQEPRPAPPKAESGAAPPENRMQETAGNSLESMGFMGLLRKKWEV
jgi:hypothetical protein